jgi:hypothetical protein
MAQDQQMTFEQIESHIKSANLEQYNKPQAEGMVGAQQDLAGQLQKVCGIYRGIRPILQAIVNFPLVPASIRNAIKTFMSVMDTICPG